MSTHLQEGAARAATPPVAPSRLHVYPDFQKQVGERHGLIGCQGRVFMVSERRGSVIRPRQVAA